MLSKFAPSVKSRKAIVKTMRNILVLKFSSAAVSQKDLHQSLALLSKYLERLMEEDDRTEMVMKSHKTT